MSVIDVDFVIVFILSAGIHLVLTAWLVVIPVVGMLPFLFPAVLIPF